MKCLIVVDAQNEFSRNGRRPVTGFAAALQVILHRVQRARRDGQSIAWVRHFNKPEESAGFQPGTWGAEFIPGFGPDPERETEREFVKNVYGAFTGSQIGQWLENLDIDEVLLVGFYTHGCLSTTAREAIMQGLKVSVDPFGTGACDMTHDVLGKQTAEEVKNSALLHLANMGVSITPLESLSSESSRLMGIVNCCLMAPLLHAGMGCTGSLYT